MLTPGKQVPPDSPDENRLTPFTSNESFLPSNTKRGRLLNSPVFGQKISFYNKQKTNTNAEHLVEVGD